ncbi:MAG TPA: tRNA (adenine-N1)-methyltransferase [Chloroflexi bacterium]|nr:tRNA (adenine-N1)-methyltransferase [Chloroflexota bacterium]
MRRAQAGDVVLLVSEKDRKSFVRTLEPGKQLQTHRGVLAHDDLIGQPLGSQVRTHLGFAYYLLPPTTDELVRNLRRESQIIFPKDSGYIIMKLGVRPGSVVIEAGTGSGGLCLVLATIVGDDGHVFSYDVRSDMQRIARRNIERARLSHRVTFRAGNVTEGFEETDVDAVFLDMRSPWEALDQARAALSGGGVLGCLVPTANQLVRLIGALDAHPGFGFIEAEELILRPYRTVPARVRPDDQIVGHTGYLIFARAVFPPAGDSAAQQALSGDSEDAQENLL